MIDPPVTIRQLQRPQFPDRIGFNWTHRVLIRHPAYPDAENTLLDLPGLDHPEGGLYYGIAFEACSILAGNRHDGYFTETIGGPRVEASNEGILRGRKYYFHIPHPQRAKMTSTKPYVYPIIPCFREWEFPHAQLPPSWNLAFKRYNGSYSGKEILDDKLRIRDESCRVSGHKWGCDSARLCPLTESVWYSDNEMSRYANDRQKLVPDTDPSQNAIFMRLDLRIILYGGNFVLVPKPSEGEMKLVVHMMRPFQELVRLYHNTEVHPLRDVAPEFLYTRFAWTVFRHVKPFLEKTSRQHPRSLLLWDERTIKANQKECTAFVQQEPEEFSDETEQSESEQDVEVEDKEEEDAGEETEEAEKEEEEEFEVKLKTEAELKVEMKVEVEVETEVEMEREVKVEPKVQTELNGEAKANIISEPEVPTESEREVTPNAKAKLNGSTTPEKRADSPDDFDFSQRKRRHSSSYSPPEYVGEEDRGRKKSRMD